MAINRISGNILQDNLVRGANLAIQTDLFYVDVFNQRIGINTAGTTHTLTVNGDTNITGNASAANFTTVGDVRAAQDISGDTVSANNITANINVNTFTLLATDSIEVGNGQAGLQIGNVEIFGGNFGAIWASNATRDLSNLALGAINDFNGNIVTIIGGDQVYVLNQDGEASFVVDTDLANVIVGGNLIIPAANGNIDMSFNYINNLSIPVDDWDATPKYYVDNATGNIVASLGNFTFGNTTMSTSLPVSDIIIAPTGNGTVIIDASSGLVVPSGDSTERPATPSPGTIRFNNDYDFLEFWNGSSWDLIESDFSISSQTIVPDGTSDNFTLNQEATAEGLILTINGITQVPNTNYTVTGNVLTMAEPPQTTDVIEVRFIAPVSSTGSIGAGVANSIAYYAASGSVINDAGPNLTWNGADQLTVAGNVSVTGAFFKVPVYANTTARNAAITSPEIGMIVVTAGVFEGYNGATWVTLG